MPDDPYKDAKFADFDSIQEGDEVELVRKITISEIEQFADLTGDRNPLHLSDGFGARTQLGGAVAHGMISASLISTVIGMMLPGPGALWLSQTIDFLNPVRCDDTVTVRTKVVHKNHGRRLLELQTTIRNQRGVPVIAGKSKVKLLEEKKAQAIPTATGTVALVTGASRGIGAAIARALAAQGMCVALNYSRSAEQAEAIVDLIRENSGTAAAFQADVSDAAQTAELYRNIVNVFGPVDVLVNNAWAKPVLRPFVDTGWDEFENQWSTGVRSAYLCCQAVLPSMIEQKFGRIINIGSIAADATPPPNQSAYIVAKASLAALTRSLAVELGPKGISVNLIAPGMTDTSFISDMPQKARMVAEMQTPMRRLAQPEDIADVVAFLTSPAARYVTGETIRVCGGQMML